jgi:hypothetical protein
LLLISLQKNTWTTSKFTINLVLISSTTSIQNHICMYEHHDAKLYCRYVTLLLF